MSFFDMPTAVVPIGDQNSVTVRKMSFGDRQAVNSKCVVYDQQVGKLDVDVSLLRLYTLQAMIVAWTGPGFADVPVSQENVARLPTTIADKVWDFVDTWSALDEDRKNA